MSDLPVFPIDVPISSMRLALRQRTRVFTAWSGQRQSVGQLGARWVYTLTFDYLTLAEYRRLSSFVNGLEGRIGAFRMPVIDRPLPSSVGTVTVEGGGQTGSVLITRGWNASQRALDAGSLVTINDQLLELKADANADQNGDATLQLSPRLRTSPAGGTEVNYTAPYAVMQLADDENPFDRESAHASFTLDLEEHI